MKIIVRMMGGLGNQIFIYAFARKMLEDFPNAEIYLDKRAYSRNKIRSFELDNFILDHRVKDFENIEIPLISKVKYDITRTIFKMFQKCFGKKVEKFFPLLASFGYCYNHHSYAQFNIPRDKEYIYVYGYFQDWKYIKDVKNKLYKEFKLRKESKLYNHYCGKIEKASCAISVRWGEDYKKAGWPICDSNYFVKGIMEICQEKLVNQLVIFSDEIDKVKNSTINKIDCVDKIYINNLTPCESLSLMMKCGDFVISNSTFSWLGAYMAKNDKKIIVVPKRWARLKYIEDTKLFEPGMIVLGTDD